MHPRHAAISTYTALLGRCLARRFELRHRVSAVGCRQGCIMFCGHGIIALTSLLLNLSDVRCPSNVFKTRLRGEAAAVSRSVLFCGASGCVPFSLPPLRPRTVIAVRRSGPLRRPHRSLCGVYHRLAAGRGCRSLHEVLVGEVWMKRNDFRIAAVTPARISIRQSLCAQPDLCKLDTVDAF